MTEKKRGFVRPFTLVDRLRAEAKRESVEFQTEELQRELGIIMGMSSIFRKPLKLDCHGLIQHFERQR